MAWRKIWQVSRREYEFNFRRPSFLFSAFGVPALTFVAMFFIFQFTADRETNLEKYQRVGYIDRAGIVTADASQQNTDYAGYVPVTSPDLTAPTADDATAQTAYFDALEADAAQQVADNQLDAYFVIGSDYVLTGQVDLYSDRNVPEALRQSVEDFMHFQVAALAPADLPVPVARLGESTSTLRDVDSGEEVSEAALAGRILLPFVFVMIYFMATSTTAQFLMSGVVEEKENRLMEILATSVRPIELLWGKLLGLAALAITQVLLWTVAGVLIASFNADAKDFISGAEFQAGDIVLLIALFILNFLVFSAAMLGIGAAVTAETESRQIAGFFTFIGVLPIMFLAAFFTNPNGALPVFLTFFPLTAATGLILRIGLTSLPLWQIALSVAIQVVTVVAVMWLAAKVFRLGMLMYGKRLTPREVWQALREGRTVMTTATGEYDAVKVPAKRKGLFGR